MHFSDLQQFSTFKFPKVVQQQR